MSGLKSKLIKSGLDVLYHTGAYKVFEPRWSGMGVIFTLHHIRPQDERHTSGFHPNGILEVTPEFLTDVVRLVAASGFDLVSLGEAVDRMEAGNTDGRFACFTIDDGYRDNLEFALPVFRRFDCPFTVFVTTGMIDGETELWWLALEQMIADNDRIEARLNGRDYIFETVTADQKQEAYNVLYWPIRAMPEAQQRQLIKGLCSRYNLDLAALCHREAMTWDEVRELDCDPLVTIGAHTVNHYALAKLERSDARHELEASRRLIAEQTGTTPEFCCYPYGDPASAGVRDFEIARELGFRAGVTMRKGMVFPEHEEHLHALPRVSLNGDFQALRYIDLYLSGAPFALLNTFRRVDAV